MELIRLHKKRWLVVCGNVGHEFTSKWKAKRWIKKKTAAVTAIKRFTYEA